MGKKAKSESYYILFKDFKGICPLWNNINHPQYDEKHVLRKKKKQYFAVLCLRKEKNEK